MKKQVHNSSARRKYFKVAATTLLLLGSNMVGYGQSQNMLWQKCFGGTRGEIPGATIQTDDGDFVIVGSTMSTDGDMQGVGNIALSDGLIMKMSPSGNILWKRTYGNAGGEHIYSVKQTIDGGFICAGLTTSSDMQGHHGGWDMWLLKLNGSGVIEWQKPLGGDNAEMAYDVVQTTDGGFVTIGYTASNASGDVGANKGLADVWLVKLDGMGNLMWEKTIGGSQNDVGTAVETTKSGGLIIAGGSCSKDGDVSKHYGWNSIHDGWVAELDNAGNIIWERNYGGTGTDVFEDIEKTEDSGYVIAGSTSSDDIDVSGLHGFNNDYWLVKIAATGAMEWQLPLGGSHRDDATTVAQTADGGYMIAGMSRSNDGDVTGHHNHMMQGGIPTSDAWIAKVSKDGSLEWQRSLGGAGEDKAECIIAARDGSLLMIAETDSTDGDVTGYHSGNAADDIWIVKLGSITPASVGEMVGVDGASIYPNPATDVLHITTATATPYMLTAISGAVVAHGITEMGDTSIDIANVAPGIYTLKLSGNVPQYFKVVKQ